MCLALHKRLTIRIGEITQVTISCWSSTAKHRFDIKSVFENSSSMHFFHFFAFGCVLIIILINYDSHKCICLWSASGKVYMHLLLCTAMYLSVLVCTCLYMMAHIVYDCTYVIVHVTEGFYTVEYRHPKEYHDKINRFKDWHENIDNCLYSRRCLYDLPIVKNFKWI